MAIVELIDYTGKGREDQEWHAANILIFTKSTRLNLDAGLLAKVEQMSEEEKKRELEYMASTIPSSWEFADVTFLISDVSRAAAQQITRTRTASYAMQSQRVNDVRDFGAVNPFDPHEELHGIFEDAVESSLCQYKALVDNGASLGDARGILPMNASCNLIAKYNLRNFVQLVQARSSLRVQGEYASIADQMKRLVINAWPWAAPFFEHPQEKAIAILEEAAREVGVTTGSGAGWQIAKAIDLIRKS